MTTTLTEAVASRTAVRTRAFVPAALLAVVMAVVGFWPTYFGPMLAGTNRASLLVHLHAAVFVTWLAAFYG